MWRLRHHGFLAATPAGCSPVPLAMAPPEPSVCPALLYKRPLIVQGSPLSTTVACVQEVKWDEALGKCTLVMIDPDAPDRKGDGRGPGSLGPWLHWLVTGAGEKPERGSCMVEYMGPAPPAGPRPSRRAAQPAPQRPGACRPARGRRARMWRAVACPEARASSRAAPLHLPPATARGCRRGGGPGCARDASAPRVADKARRFPHRGAIACVRR